METDVPSVNDEGSAELWQQERVWEAQVKFNEKNTPGTFLPKAKQAKEAQQE